jgi:hypothetical protein
MLRILRIHKNNAYPIGIRARSKPPNFCPISLKAGQHGTWSSFCPSFTERYPVSPANHTFLPWVFDESGKISSTAQEAHRDLKRSNMPRPVKCCAGVQVRRNSPWMVSFDEEVVGSEMVTTLESHQSRQCALTFLDAK